MPHRTSPTVPPAIRVWTLVKYSLPGNDSIFTLTPVSCVNFGRTSFIVSSSGPVRMCSRSSPPRFFDWAVAWAAGFASPGFASAAGLAGAVVAAGWAAGAAGLDSAGLVSVAGFDAGDD